MEDLMQFLREEGISEDVLHEVHEYVVSHPVSDAMKQRIPVPHFMYYGVNVGKMHCVRCYVGKTYCLLVKRQREKMFCVKILPMYFKDQAGIFLSM